MTLAAARYSLLDGYPILEVEVDGRPARLHAEAKPTIHAAGLVFLGAKFEDLMPSIRFTPADGGPTDLDGFSGDPRLFRLYDDFLRACDREDYAVGPVAIPA